MLMRFTVDRRSCQCKSQCKRLPRMPRGQGGALRLRGEHDLDGAAFVHGTVGLGSFLQRQNDVEHAARVDGAGEDVGEQFGDVGPGRSHAAGNGDVRVEQVAQRGLGAPGRDADEAAARNSGMRKLLDQVACIVE